MNEYFIQNGGEVGSERFEQVDEYTWRNSRAALKDDGTPRYPAGAFKFARVDGKVLFENNPSEAAIGTVARVLGIKLPQGMLPGGAVASPRYIKFVSRGNAKPFLHEVGGPNYRIAA
jgi:hypothetical protein